MNMRSDQSGDWIKDLIRKDSIPVDCGQDMCPHSSTCCKMCTEIARIKEDDNIDIFFIGQGAGEQEVKLNRPFVGPAGKLLRNIVLELWREGKRFNIAMSNTVRCRPMTYVGKNRPPVEEELAYCMRHLRRDVNQLSPSIVMPVGGSAMGDFLPPASGKSITRYRGKIIGKMNNISIIPTFHPAAALHSGGEKGAEIEEFIKEDIKTALTEIQKLPADPNMLRLEDKNPVIAAW